MGRSRGLISCLADVESSVVRRFQCEEWRGFIELGGSMTSRDAATSWKRR
jgi:hypothetical protein